MLSNFRTPAPREEVKDGKVVASRHIDWLVVEVEPWSLSACRLRAAILTLRTDS